MYGSSNKVLPYIDMILVKTQFLVFNNEFINHLPLVKVLMYDIMKYHFDFVNYRVVYNPSNEAEIFDAELVADLLNAIKSFKVKLGAAYARLRIESKAHGYSSREQLENILPEHVRERENMASELLRTLEINKNCTNRESLFEKFRQLGLYIETDGLESPPEKTVYIDETFPEMLVVSATCFGVIKASPLFHNGSLIFQDRASMYGKRKLEKYIKPGMTVIYARAGCGTRLPNISAMVGKDGKIFAFETRQGHRQALQNTLNLYKCQSKPR